ncbi:MAG: hypothetical protein OXI05_10765 [Bacteroidota bacterium]|nr:hypothetical protein [Bacteroidota bacterium]MDE2646300.1 hypothetical protein [Bacteroidota bacterium]
MTSNDWYFGLDAGATKTRLYARSRVGHADLELLEGAANALRQGVAQTASVLSSLINDALDELPGGTLRAVHAGIAGASAPSIQKELVRRIRLLVNSDSPFNLTISHDGVIALEGAFAGQSGLLFISGTGSGVMARTGADISEVDHVGGWGHIIGDEGSGYAIGKRALAAVGHAFDGGPKTRLTHLAKRHLNIYDRHSLLSMIGQSDWKFQNMAPLALNAAEDGDDIAASVVQEETKLLARQAELMLKKYPDLDPRYTIIGGLSNNKFYVNRLCAATENIWPIAKFVAPKATPAEGAVQIAMQQSIDSDAVQ